VKATTTNDVLRGLWARMMVRLRMRLHLLLCRRLLVRLLLLLLLMVAHLRIGAFVVIQRRSF